MISEMSSITKDQIISNIYYDLETDYGSVKNTFEQARQTERQIDNIRGCSEMDETTT